MVLQPIAALDGSGVVGFEALARFPAMPSSRPDIWFAEAHRAGVGVQLELLAVRSALAALPTLPDDAFLAINVSPDTATSPQLLTLIEGDHARRVVLELTEHAPVADYERLGDALRRLRHLGARIAVDDCGAGFASLRHVALLAPEFLKLDVVLCRDLHQPIKAALARALATFARETGSVLVAEGIEDGEDLEALRALGVQLGQGYLIGRPEAFA
jgi:EAL domain-containing protein (putative c-di-GMP-specific phosphodiesterase class I)